MIELLIIIMSQLSNLKEMFKIQKIEYRKNETWICTNRMVSTDTNDKFDEW